MLTATITPTGSALSGSPIRLDVSSDSPVTYIVKVGGTARFTGSGVGSFYVFLQDIIDGYINPVPIDPSGSTLLTPVTSNTASVAVEITNADGETVTRSFTAYKGGLSAVATRSLGLSNIFTSRFNGSGNRFFTTRGASSRITMRRSELAPLLFIMPSAGIAVTLGQHTQALTGTTGGLYAINIAALARTYPDENAIVLSIGGSAVLTVAIEPERPSRNRLMVRFLNSLGAYEYVEFSGTADYGAEYPDDATYERYDNAIDDFVLERTARKGHGMLTAYVGYRSEAELLFLQDLANSPDVTLLGYKGNDYKVTASCTGYTVRLQDNKPNNLTFVLTLADKDSYLEQ